VPKKIAEPNAIREKLLNLLSNEKKNEKCAHKMLMKLTPVKRTFEKIMSNALSILKEKVK